MTERSKTKNYVVMIDEQLDTKFASLKKARAYCKSLLNINEVKGIQVIVDIYKEVVSLEKLDSDISDKNVVGLPSKVFNMKVN